MHYNGKGIGLIACEWFLTLFQVLAVTIRIYSRTFLTRSVGSDDFLIVLGFGIEIVACICDLQAFLHGLSQHEGNLTADQYSAEQKWEYLGYTLCYIVYFLVRASVMLFVLRLLPSYKKWQRKTIYAAFALNFLVTLYTLIMFGISCIPFTANWESVPNSKCMSKDLLVITNQINASLACVCDIVTALIPQCLLWNVQMKAKTKRQLDAIFSLGLVTAALSIGRAASVTKAALLEDTTYNTIPWYYLSAFEVKLGIIFACGPAIRQYWGYRSRTHTSLPTKNRQYPNEDFEKMRRRINLRDIFWYRNAPMVGNRVFEAAPIFQHSSPPPDGSSTNPQTSSEVSSSVLDVWERRIKKFIGATHDQEARHRLPSKDSNPTSSDDSEQQDRSLKSELGSLPQDKPHAARRWGLLPRRASSARETFLLSDSRASASVPTVMQSERGSSIHDHELTYEVRDQRPKAAYGP